MLGAGYVLKNKGHVNVEIVFMTLRGKWRAYVGFVFSLLGVLYCGVLAWLGWLSVESSISVGERSFDLGLYLWPVKTLFVLGICLFGLQFIVDSYEYFNSYRDGKN
jgi:TRAP-type mannitol/chloroaromatic compound transport system permease small subunit